MYRRFFKRVVDLIVAVFGLIISGWLMAIVAVCLRIAHGPGGVLFIQSRPGFGGKPFRMFKFKSMTDACDSQGNLLPNSERLTPIGRFIRKTSFDELPQIFNILRGDMSFIGPRPLLEHYMPYYSEREKLRHSVRPGLTGWSQVNGRNDLSWDDKLEKDVWYTEHVSFMLDLRILFLTFKKVFKQEGTGIEHLVPLDVERSK